MYSTGNSAQCYVAAWMGGGFSREWIDTRICTVESLHCFPETMRTLLTGYACMLSCFSCVRHCETPTDYSLPGSCVHGILQVRILEWVAMPSSKGSSPPRVKLTSRKSPALAGGFFTTSTIPKQNKKFKKKRIKSCRYWEETDQERAVEPARVG